MNREGSRTPVGRRGMAHVAVNRDTQSQVVGVNALVVVGHMAAFAGIRRVVVIALVANCTVVGYGDMRPGKRIHAIVVESRRRPGILGMALFTICRELPRQVVGVGGRVVITCMAAKAGIRGIVVVAVVAFGTIVGNQCMGPAQHIIVVMNGKSSRHPVGCSSMAHVAVVG